MYSPQKTELQEVMSCLMWMLEIKLSSSTKSSTCSYPLKYLFRPEFCLKTLLMIKYHIQCLSLGRKNYITVCHVCVVPLGDVGYSSELELTATVTVSARNQTQILQESNKIAQQTKLFVTKSSNLCLIPRTYIVGRFLLPKEARPLHRSTIPQDHSPRPPNDF